MIRDLGFPSLMGYLWIASFCLEIVNGFFIGFDDHKNCYVYGTEVRKNSFLEGGKLVGVEG